MGIAWLDDDPPPMAEPALRVGGVPLLSSEQTWPNCPRCGLPMLFRAQIPLALTSLVSPYDERLLLFFECHSNVRRTACNGGALVITKGVGSPREAPECQYYGVHLFSFGDFSEQVARVVDALKEDADQDEWEEVADENEWEEVMHSHIRRSTNGDERFKTPLVVLNNVPSSIGFQAVHTLSELGATVELLPASPTTLPDIRGGKLVPFDDGTFNACRTTLPSIRKINANFGARALRGLMGGATLGNRDYTYNCGCGRQTRTAVRLLADDSVPKIPLGQTIAQVCLHCGTGSLYRRV
jgi:hypothetical protein